MLAAVEFDLRTVLEDALEAVGWRAFDKGLDLVLFLDAATPTRVRGDPHRVRQVPRPRRVGGYRRALGSRRAGPVRGDSGAGWGGVAKLVPTE